MTLNFYFGCLNVKPVGLRLQESKSFKLLRRSVHSPTRVASFALLFVFILFSFLLEFCYCLMPALFCICFTCIGCCCFRSDLKIFGKIFFYWFVAAQDAFAGPPPELRGFRFYFK